MSLATQPTAGSSAPIRAAAETRLAWCALALAVLVPILAIAFAALVHVRVIRANLPLSWDEAAHSLFGLAIAHDLRTGDVLGLAYDLYRQVYWPPLHSVMVGAAFATFGERISVARDVSVVAYALIPIALLAAGRVMHSREDWLRGWVAGGVAGVFAIAAPAFLPFASLAFLELPAILAVTLALLAYFAAERAVDRPRRRVLIAAGILLAFFLKTNYGVLLMVVFAIDAVIDARLSARRLLSRRNAYVILPVAVVLAVWFAYPAKLPSTIRALVNKQAGGVDPWTLDGLLFYPRSLLVLAGSPAMFAVLLAGVVGTWGLRRAPNVRLLLLLAGAQFLLAELHHTKENRHIFPMLPPLFLLAGAAAGRLARHALGARQGTRVRPVAYLVGLGFAGIVAAQLWTLAAGPLPTAWPRMPARPGQAHDRLIEAVASAVGRGERVLLVGTFDLSPGPPVVDWELAVSRGLLAIEHSGASAVIDRDRSVAAALRRAPLPSWVVAPVTRVLERSDTPASIRTMYAGLPEPLDSEAFAASFGETLARGNIDRLIVATVEGDGVMYPAAYFAPALSHPSLIALSSLVEGAGAQVRLDQFRVTSDTVAPGAELRRDRVTPR